MVDLNPLHYINKFNHMFGDSVASGLEFLGISDPAVDPDGVREIAKKWRHLAQGLDDASTAADRALSGVEWEGKAAKAFHKRSKAARKQAGEMAHSLREGGKALDDFADKAHELLSEIGVILAEIAEFEIAGLALSVLTAGASEVASTLMSGERALKVVALVGRIEKEGTTLGTVVRRVMEVIRQVERALKALKEIRGVAAAGRMAKEGLQFTAFQTMLEDPSAFKDPEKLAGILTEGALMGVGFGMLGKALGKGLKALGPAALAKLSKAMGLDCAAFERLKLNPGFDKLPASIRNIVKTFVRDPIDVATGDMALTRTDITLPGVLPLVLERTHISSYRHGGWFGPTWASTLDQRVQADEDGFVYATGDGARLCFPRPDTETNTPVRPDTPGSRLTLAWDTDVDGGIRVHDADAGLSYVFHSPVAAAGDTAVDLPLQYIQDRNNNRITIEYTEGDVPGAVVHSGGYRIALDHDPARSRITGLRLIDPAHPNRPGTSLLTLTYNEQGHLVEEFNSSGLPMRYTYDADGRITSWTDRNNTTYWYQYDDQGRVVATGGTGGALASTLTYDATTRTTRVTDSHGHTRTYEHNEHLRLIRETDPLGNTTTQEWDEDLQLTAVTDALGRTSGYRYDELGHVTSVVRPDGSASCVEYNDLGSPTQVTGPDGFIWRYTYDECGNRTAVTDPRGATTHFIRSTNGSLVEARDAADRTSTYENNAAGLTVSAADGLGNITHWAYNSLGLTTAVTDALGNVSRLDWTVDGWLVGRTNPDGSHESWQYDGEGNCVRHVDATGQSTIFEYTHFDRLSARTGPGGERYTFTYDTELRLTQVTNPQGLVWNYIYDAAGQLLSETDFDGRTTRYTYDATGRLADRTNALGQRICYRRDALGRIVAKDADGATTVYTYTANGALTTAIGPDSSLHVELDSAGRRISETVDGRTMSFAYDASGNRTLRTTPSGARSNWAYDAAGRTSRLATAGHIMDFAYDAADREIVRRIDDSLTLTRGYDSVDRLVAQASIAPGGHRIIERSYAYRPDGYLTGVDDSRAGRSRFDLDAHGRVTAVQAAGWSERYTYDTAGNQTEAMWPMKHPGHEAVGPRAYTGTRLTRAGGVHYEHDAQGRVVVRRKTRLSRKPDIWRYEWDSEDRLTAVTTPDGSRWRYIYDPLGRRTAKLRLDADGETVLERTAFSWDGNILCEQTTEQGDAGVRTSLTWDHDELSPLCQSERVWATEAPQETIDQRFFAIVTDLIGTPTELVSSDGKVAWHTRSTLWGTIAWNRDASAYTPLRFPGQYHDPETGLHYNHHRHYDPETARYTSPDPLGLLPAPNPVAYVHNPHSWSDPLGLAPMCHLHGGDTGSPNGLGVLPGPAPQKAVDMLNNVNARPGGIGKIDGYHGNANWGNNLSALPGGKYKEWDVNAKVDLPRCSAPGCGKEIRGPERLLTPKDGPGPAYYTPDHYGSFYYVGEFTG
ncbi:DUF6531 domain-containing protein [Streptomyces sp. CG4]|uniref:DUF6531 domain-containing protein n=1 Tax=Streptomyces sp. CG4 TaxID=408783 RepID=UPI0034E2E5E9